MNAPTIHLKLWEDSSLDGAPTGKNFLFLSSMARGGPDDSRELHEKFVATARCMAKEGYVYLASPLQNTVEDDEFGVRHLPLHGDIPSFGALTAVVVLEDAALLRRARQKYPEALAFMFSTPQLVSNPSVHDETAVTPLSVAA